MGKEMTKCLWCGKDGARAYLHGLNFCKRCYPVMKVSRLSLNHTLITKLQKKIARAKVSAIGYHITNPNTKHIKF